MYLVYLTQADHTIELKFNSYDEVLAMFQLLRVTRQDDIYFQCYDPIGKGLIHRFVVPYNENMIGASNIHA